MLLGGGIRVLSFACCCGAWAEQKPPLRPLRPLAPLRFRCVLTSLPGMGSAPKTPSSDFFEYPTKDLINRPFASLIDKSTEKAFEDAFRAASASLQAGENESAGAEVYGTAVTSTGKKVRVTLVIGRDNSIQAGASMREHMAREEQARVAAAGGGGGGKNDSTHAAAAAAAGSSAVSAPLALRIRVETMDTAVGTVQIDETGKIQSCSHYACSIFGCGSLPWVRSVACTPKTTHATHDSSTTH